MEGRVMEGMSLTAINDGVIGGAVRLGFACHMASMGCGTRVNCDAIVTVAEAHGDEDFADTSSKALENQKEYQMSLAPLLEKVRQKYSSGDLYENLASSLSPPTAKEEGRVVIGGKTYNTKSLELLKCCWHALNPHYEIATAFERALETFEGDLSNSTEFARLAETVLTPDLLSDTVEGLKIYIKKFESLAGKIGKRQRSGTQQKTEEGN